MTAALRLGLRRASHQAVVAPPRETQAPVWQQPCPYRCIDGGAPVLWLLGAHGGAGVTALTRVWPRAADCGRRWPTAAATESPYVAIVVRETVTGLAAADALLRQHHAGLAGDATLIGLVTVAARPGRTPTPIRRDLALYGELAPNVWRLGWHESLILDLPRTVTPAADALAAGRAINDVLIALRQDAQSPESPIHSERRRTLR